MGVVRIRFPASGHNAGMPSIEPHTDCHQCGYPLSLFAPHAIMTIVVLPWAGAHWPQAVRRDSPGDASHWPCQCDRRFQSMVLSASRFCFCVRLHLNHSDWLGGASMV